jgi:hypothetical protein
MTDHPITPPPELIIKAADDAGLCFPTCWGLVDAEEDAADDAAFAATSPEAAEIVAKHEQLKRDRLQQLRNFWNTAASYGAGQEPEWPTVMEIIELADEIEAEGLGQVDLVRRALARWGRPELEVPTDEELIQRLLSLAEQAVKEALDLEFEDPEDRYIWRELQELKQLVKEVNGKA